MRAHIAPEERFLWFARYRKSAPLGQLSLKVQVHHLQLPEAMADWSLTSLQLKLIKVGARDVRHARAITFQLAEMTATGPMVRTILSAIRRL